MANSYPERRSPSRRFLPPDPRTSEPYRFTPQLALRLGVLAALALAIFAILFLRLWALEVLSGDRYLNAAQNNQLRTVPVEAPRGSIVDRAGRTIVVERARHRRADLAGRPAEGRPLRDVQEALEDPARAAPAADEGARGGQGRPADADPRQDGRARGPGDVPERAPPRVPRRRDRRRPTCATTSTGRSPPRCSATSARSRRRSSKRLEQDGYRGGEKIGKTGVEAAFDTYLRGMRAPRSSGSTRSAGPQGGFEPGGPPQPGKTVRLTIDVGLQRAAERAIRDGIALAQRTGRVQRRTAARSWRSTRATARCSPWPRTRPTSPPSTSAASIRRSSSRSRSRRSRRSATIQASTARSPASIRPARPSSR